VPNPVGLLRTISKQIECSHVSDTHLGLILYNLSVAGHLGRTVKY